MLDWRQACRESLISYAIAQNDDYESAPHLTLLAEALEKVYRGEITRLLVFMPPRHGKTELVSKTFPAWVYGKDPDMQFIVASYALDLAEDIGEMVRDRMNQPIHQQIFPGSKIRSSSSAKKRFRVSDGKGIFVASGVGGPITGRGMHIGIIDDPVKNDQEADSEAIQTRNWGWYKSTFRTRLAKRSKKRPRGGAIVVCQTRWNMNDLSGKILQAMKEDGEQWVILELDALIESESEAAVDPLGRKMGEALWPTAFSTDDLLATKKAIGTRAWNALYKQKPSPDEGNIIKRAWIKYYRVPPARFDEIIESWDFAFKDEDSSSWVVGQVWGRAGGEYYLLDQVRDRMSFTDSSHALVALTMKWRALTRLDSILVEDKANGPAIISQLHKKVSGIIPVEPDGSKEARVKAIAPYWEAGNVYVPHPETAPWINDFIEEIVSFPNGLAMDQADSMSQALYRFTGAKGQGFIEYYKNVMKENAA